MRNLMLVVLGAGLLFFSPLDSVQASSDCRATLAQMENFAKLRVPQKTAALAKRLIDFVSAEKRIPTTAELAKYSGLSVADVDAYFTFRTAASDVSGLLAISKKQFPDFFDKLRNRTALKVASFVRKELRAPLRQEMADLMELSLEDFEALLGPWQSTLSYTLREHSFQIEPARQKILKTYAQISKRLYRTAIETELAAELGITIEQSRTWYRDLKLFDSFGSLRAVAHETFPTYFREVLDVERYSSEYNESMLSAVRDARTIVVIGAVAGAPVEPHFLAAARKYAELRQAVIIIKPVNMMTHGLDPALLELPNSFVLTSDMELGPQLRLYGLKTLAKMINPLQGVDRMGPRGQSQIIASPKMHLLTIPTVNNDTRPHQIMTTGVVTLPNYAGEKYVQLRTDELAQNDHFMGLLVVEKDPGLNDFADLGGRGEFRWRRVEYIPEKRGFMDLDHFYTADGAQRVERMEALVLGDIHVTDTHANIEATIGFLIQRFHPKYLVAHDIFHGGSISRHERDNQVTLAQKAKAGKLDLRAELDNVARWINAVLALDPSFELVLVNSNHDRWLRSYLQRGQFEPWNFDLATELAAVMARGEDPLEYVLLKEPIRFPNEKGRPQGPRVEQVHRVRFHEDGRSWKVGPKHRMIELAAHGDAGANGGKGSLRTFERGMGRAIFGHTHTEAYRNGVVNVGMIVRHRVGYNDHGLSNWVQSAAIAGPNGEIQLLRYFSGKWFMDGEAEPLPAEQFFEPGYPAVHERQAADLGTGQVDQWSD